MRDGSNAMSERDFLISFMKELNFFDEEWGKAFIDEFLKHHHTNYYEVEFVHILPESDDEYEICERNRTRI